MFRFNEVKRARDEVLGSGRSPKRIRADRARPQAWKQEREPGTFDMLNREAVRSRRFGHPFFAVRLPDPHRAEAYGWQERALARLRSLVRSVDSVWVDRGDIFLLLPETDRAQGTVALRRVLPPLEDVIPGEARDRLSAAVFAPGECSTVGALLSVLYRRVREEKAARKPASSEKTVAPVTEPERTGG